MVAYEFAMKSMEERLSSDAVSIRFFIIRMAILAESSLIQIKVFIPNSSGSYSTVFHYGLSVTVRNVCGIEGNYNSILLLLKKTSLSSI